MSRTAKLVLAAALVVIVVVVLGWASIASLAGAGPEGATSAFFKSIADKGAQAAYASTSASFQQATPVDAFVSTVQARGLADYRSSNWSVSSRQGDLAEVNGSVMLRSGGSVPADVHLVRGGSGWQVLALDLPQGGLAGAAAPAGAADQAGYEAGGASAQSQPAATQPYTGMQGAAGPQTAPAGYSPAYANAPTGAPGGAAEPAGAGGPMTVSSSRVAHMCGKSLMRNAWIDTVELHCPSAIQTAPGSTTQCMALINGHRTSATATLQSYDPSVDNAEVTCRLNG